MLIAMLSPVSLAALSNGAAQSAFGMTHPVPRVRAVDGQPPQPVPQRAPLAVAPAPRDGSTVPDRSLPRGSLLDLSV
jgi:hypothetical protein